MDEGSNTLASRVLSAALLMVFFATNLQIAGAEMAKIVLSGNLFCLPFIWWPDVVAGVFSGRGIRSVEYSPWAV